MEGVKRYGFVVGDRLRRQLDVSQRQPRCLPLNPFVVYRSSVALCMVWVGELNLKLEGECFGCVSKDELDAVL